MQKQEQLLRYYTKDGQEIVFPVATVTGARPGPHVVITAGIHGGEYPPIAAAIAFYRQVDPREVSGTVTLVTVCNMPAFAGRTPFVTPVDGKNPNRAFPGREDGSYTECMVYYLFRDIISRADYHLDLHCGDLIETLTPFGECCRGISEEIDQKSREIAAYYGVPHVITPKADLSKETAGLNYENSQRHGIPAALLEIGEHGILDRASVDGHLYGIQNVLRHFGVLAGQADEPKEVEYFSGFEEVCVPVRGIFYCDVFPGDYLKKGQPIGRVEDCFGNHLADVRAPADGKVMYITHNPAMIEDDFVLDMAVHGG